MDWAGNTAEETAKSWAIEHLLQPHFEAMDRATEARVVKVREAVRERLEAEIRYWDQRVDELKRQEQAGQRPRLNSGRARARADDLEARLARRRLELDRENDLHNSPPTVRYLLDPFRDYTPHFAQTGVTFNVADLLTAAGPPR